MEHSLINAQIDPNSPASSLRADQLPALSASCQDTLTWLQRLAVDPMPGLVVTRVRKASAHPPKPKQPKGKGNKGGKKSKGGGGHGEGSEKTKEQEELEEVKEVYIYIYIYISTCVFMCVCLSHTYLHSC